MKDLRKYVAFVIREVMSPSLYTSNADMIQKQVEAAGVTNQVFNSLFDKYVRQNGMDMVNFLDGFQRANRPNNSRSIELVLDMLAQEPYHSQYIQRYSERSMELITKFLSDVLALYMEPTNEETSSTDKKNDIKTDQSTWAKEFKVGAKPNSNVMNGTKTDKPMNMGVMI